MKNYVLFLSACLLFFSMACTVNKRAHRPGYNVEWHSANPKPKEHPKLEEQGSTTAPKKSLSGEEARAEVAESFPSTEQSAASDPALEDNTLAGGESSTGILDKGFKIGKSNLGDSHSETPESKGSADAPQQRNSRADNLAIWGFVISLAAFWIPFAGPIAAIVLSSIALNQMRDNPIAHRHRGLAIAGLAIGIAGLAFWGIWTFGMIYWWW